MNVLGSLKLNFYSLVGVTSNLCSRVRNVEKCLEIFTFHICHLWLKRRWNWWFFFSFTGKTHSQTTLSYFVIWMGHPNSAMTTVPWFCVPAVVRFQNRKNKILTNNNKKYHPFRYIKWTSWWWRLLVSFLGRPRPSLFSS